VSIALSFSVTREKRSMIEKKRGETIAVSIALTFKIAGERCSMREKNLQLVEKMIKIEKNPSKREKRHYREETGQTIVVPIALPFL
jgi:hypothetical protein